MQPFTPRSHTVDPDARGVVSPRSAAHSASPRLAPPVPVQQATPTRIAPPALASSSSDAPGPSPPLHRARRVLPSLQDGLPRGTTSLRLFSAGAAVAPSAGASTPRAATVPTAPTGGVAPSPTPAPGPRRALARGATKRRVIEQDESLSEAEAEARGGMVRIGEAGAGGRPEAARVKRRRMIEQDVTPSSTQGEGGQAQQQCGEAGFEEEQQRQGQVRGGERRVELDDEEGQTEPDTQ